MIYTVTLTPALDKTVVIPDFTVDHVNRIRTVRLDPGGKGINVSKVLKALGMESVATGILGGGTGRFILDRLDEMRNIAFGLILLSDEDGHETRRLLSGIKPQGNITRGLYYRGLQEVT